MAYDVVKFVDSIASSPTTRLDVNDGAQWTVRDFQAPPPRIRRSAVSNAMTDGAYVSSSSYDARTLFLEIDLITTTQDTGATELQKLARELDRTTNYLMYQPNGLTKPVFFKTWRSDFADVVEVRVVGAYRRFQVEILAEPFALGLRETAGPYTVRNDPAAGTNGLYVDVTGVIGDVPAPAVIKNTTAIRQFTLLSTRARDIPADHVFFLQAESATLGTDTTNPGGGPDAAMSGTGTNNYVRTSFATTATLATRVTWTTSTHTHTTDARRRALAGQHRVIAVVRRSDSTSDMSIKASASSSGIPYSKQVTLPSTTQRIMVDLGLISLEAIVPGGYSTQAPIATVSIAFQAERTSGAGTLDWDYFLLIPADETTLMWSMSFGSTSYDVLIDGVLERVSLYEDGVDPFGGAADIYGSAPSATGGFPVLVPNQTNRFYLMTGSLFAALPIPTVTDTDALTFTYLPLYLYVRPSTT